MHLKRMLKAFQKNQIFVVSSAGNDGPTLNSIGSTATSKVSLAIGALDYAPSSRVMYEYLGLINGLGSGQGVVMRPSSEVRVTNFSSRGPLRSGHLGLDIAALGLWNFHAGPDNELFWAGGTSFSAPAVSGTAALLNAWKKRARKRHQCESFGQLSCWAPTQTWSVKAGKHRLTRIWRVRRRSRL
jgi:hypothetical protein